MAAAFDAENKCVQRARKRLQSEKKWGRWAAMFNIAIGTVCFILVIAFLIFIYKILTDLAPPGPQGAQFQNILTQGLAVGIIFGIMIAGIITHGAHALINGITALRGDQISRTLVAYHDALVELTRDRQVDPSSDSPDKN
jgi:hypothetical protein